MRITEAAQRLGTSARMLRYRESLGLLPPGHRRRPDRLPRTTRGGTGGAARRQRQPAGPGGADGGHRAASPGSADGGHQAASPGSADGGHRAASPGSADGGHRSAGPGAAHRQFSDADLAAAALGLSIERRYDISPAALAFGIRVLADPRVRSEVAELGRRIGRIQPPPARALDFEQERALRLLRLDQQRR